MFIISNSSECRRIIMISLFLGRLLNIKHRNLISEQTWKNVIRYNSRPDKKETWFLFVYLWFFRQLSFFEVDSSVSLVATEFCVTRFIIFLSTKISNIIQTLVNWSKLNSFGLFQIHCLVTFCDQYHIMISYCQLNFFRAYYLMKLTKYEFPWH